MKLASRSIEVINATLLEVFVVLSFISMAVVVAKETDLENARSAWKVERASLQSATRDAEKRAEEARLIALESGQFVSRYWPDCRKIVQPIAAFSLLGDSLVDVRALRPEFYEFVSKPSEEVVSFAGLSKLLGAFLRFNAQNSCKFNVDLIDGQYVSKDEFKEAKKLLRQFFRVNERG